VPIYKNGAINVALLDGLAPRLTRLIGHLEAGAAIRHIHRSRSSARWTD
jgi:hypothetical protein